MKIGFFADGYLPQKNGVATSVAEYADALASRGHEVTIIAPKYPGYTDTKHKVIRLSSINYKKQVGVRLAIYLPEKAFRQLLRLQFDVIHGHGDGPITMLGWTIAKRKGVPFILSHHTFWNRYTHYLPAGKLIHPKIVEKITQLFSNSCSAIISPSYMSKRELKNYGVTKPITVIHHGLDLSNYKTGDSKYLRKKIKIPDKNKILLYVGRLGKEKSVDLLLESFSRIYKTHPDTSLVLVGDGPQKLYLKSLAKNLGIEKSTHFIGEIDYKKIPSVFHSADLFLFTSSTETLGKVVLEAMAAGLPIVTLNIPPFKELIKNKHEGMLVRPNAKAISHAVINLIDDSNLRNQMSKHAKIKADEFSINNAIKRIESIYTKQISLYESRRRQGFTQIISKVRNFLDVEFR